MMMVKIQTFIHISFMLLPIIGMQNKEITNTKGYKEKILHRYIRDMTTTKFTLFQLTKHQESTKFNLIITTRPTFTLKPLPFLTTATVKVNVVTTVKTTTQNVGLTTKIIISNNLIKSQTPTNNITTTNKPLTIDYSEIAIRFINNSKLYKCEICNCNKPKEPKDPSKKPLPSYNFLAMSYLANMPFKYDVCDVRSNCKILPIAKYKYEELMTPSKSKGLLITNCGSKHFLLSKDKGVYNDHTKYCCGLGMVPAIIESRDELNCIYDQFKSTADVKISKIKKYSIGYLDITMRRDFQSCPEKIKLPQDLWAPSQPDNMMSVQYGTIVSLEGMKSNIGFDDVNGLLSFNPMCQVSIDNGMNNTEVSINEELFKTRCGAKRYIFTRRKVFYLNIWELCCSIGSIPASIESKSDLQCLYNKYFAKSGENASSIFFTGQLDANLDRNMISCSTRNTIPSNLWLEGEPNNDMKREACVALKFDNKTAGLIDIRCGEIINVLCEQTSKKNQSAKAISLATTIPPSTTTPITTTTILSTIVLIVTGSNPTQVLLNSAMETSTSTEQSEEFTIAVY